MKKTAAPTRADRRLGDGWPAVTDLIAGQVQVMFDNTPNVLPHVRAGKLKALAVSTKKRTPLTVAGTPREVVQRLNAEMVKILVSPEHFSGFLKSEVDRWAKVVRNAGIKAD